MNKITIPDPGDVLVGRYRLDEVLGKGGFGIVYKATHLEMNRTVAIKTLLPQAALSDIEIERFKQEALLASHLTHPNSITLFDYGQTDDGLLFLVMEYLKGETLKDRMKKLGPMSPERVRHIVVQVLKSLSEAHSHDIVHRDLKPENIFMCDMPGERDFAKVLDFGVAKMLDSGDNNPDADLSQGASFGTPRYMAPEQIMGQQIGPYTDLYALGLIAFEMLTGRPAYSGRTALEIVTKQIHSPEPRLPATIVHTPVGKMIAQCVLKDAEKRLSSAQDALELIQPSDKPAAPAIPPPRRLGAPPRLGPPPKLSAPKPTPPAPTPQLDPILAPVLPTPETPRSKASSIVAALPAGGWSATPAGQTSNAHEEAVLSDDVSSAPVEGSATEVWDTDQLRSKKVPVGMVPPVPQAAPSGLQPLPSAPQGLQPLPSAPQGLQPLPSAGGMNDDVGMATTVQSADYLMRHAQEQNNFNAHAETPLQPIPQAAPQAPQSAPPSASSGPVQESNKIFDVEQTDPHIIHGGDVPAPLSGAPANASDQNMQPVPAPTPMAPQAPHVMVANTAAPMPPADPYQIPTDHNMSPPPVAGSKSKTNMILAVGVLFVGMLALVGVGTFLFLSMSDSKAPPASPPPAVAQAEPETPAASPTEEPEKTEEPAKPQEAVLIISSVPAGAMVFLGDSEVGKTPLNLKRKELQGSVTVVLKADGFDDETTVIDYNGNTELEIELTPKSGDDAPAAVAAKTEPEPTTPQAKEPEKPKESPPAVVAKKEEPKKEEPKKAAPKKTPPAVVAKKAPVKKATPKKKVVKKKPAKKKKGGSVLGGKW